MPNNLKYSVAYIDTNTHEVIESYNYKGDKYGGGRIVAAPFLDKFDNFHIFANERCFVDIPINKKSQCHALNDEQRGGIRAGMSLETFVPNLDNYDLIFAHQCGVYINTQKERKKSTWTLGWKEQVNPGYKHFCYFSPFQYPILQRTDHVTHKVVIGPRVDHFHKYEKQDFLCQISRQSKIYSSIEVAELCNKYGIKGYFAGPIDKDYPFLDSIDNRNTFYLGEISLDEKIALVEKAKLVTQMQHHFGLITLFAKEAMVRGCGVLYYPYGEWEQLLEPIHGFPVRNEKDFYTAWAQRDHVNQYSCWKLAKEHSEDLMIELFSQAFERIVDDTV